MSRVAEVRGETPCQLGELTAPQIKLVSPLWLRVGFWACVMIAVAAVIRRVFALYYPSQSAPPQMAALDKVFASHAALTLAHILPALAFVLVTPFFVFRSSDETAWQERVLFPLGLLV